MLIEGVDILVLLVVGLIAGVAGGMLGIGGSVVIIPALAWVFHRRPVDDQHLFQAAAMLVNVAVALPATVRHHKARAIPWHFVRIFLPATLVFIVAGVMISNALDGEHLRVLFALFLLYVVGSTLLKLARDTPEYPTASERITTARGATVGAVTGTAAGLLGIGGGIVSVPMAHVLCRVSLRRCIAASAFVMIVSSAFGATLKILTLPAHDQSPAHALVMALMLAPTALIGGWVGAGLTHRAPIQTLRAVFSVLLLIMAGRMAGLY